jgi:NADH-quinone oxidoreductase subunit L
MYLAIVFLPLVGAVVAGLIALAGARARFPGGSPTAIAEDHAGEDMAAHSAPVGPGSASAVVHESHVEHHPVEPAAAGSRAAELITTTLLFVSMILSWIAFVAVGFGQDERVPIVPWRWASARTSAFRSCRGSSPAICGSNGHCASTH